MVTPTIHFRDYFTSVGDIWVLWAVGLVAMVLLVRRAYRGRKWAGAAAFAADERGTSYALSYVMTFPFYLLLMCLIIQATLILMVKMGTVYAAHAAARTAVVWRPSQPERPTRSDLRYDYTHKKAERAAAMAMTPFASGLREHRNNLPLLGFLPARTAGVDAPLYLLMYQILARHNAGKSNDNLYLLRRYGSDAVANKEYVVNKFLVASATTFVELDEEIAAWNEDVELTVTYMMPMHVPAVGRVFGSRMGGLFVREIATTATMPSEAPETESNRLNIPYDPEQLVGLKVILPK